MKIKIKIQKLKLLPITFLLGAVMIFPFRLYSQEKNTTVPDGTEGEVLTVPIIDTSTGKAKNLAPNEFNTSFTTIKVGLGFLGEYAAFKQDDDFKQQMDTANLEMKSMFDVRDFRLLVSGQLKTKRTITWKFGYMRDGDKDKWFVRESGIIVGVPELAGNFFVGRTKEGYSLVKVMNGYAPWGAERQMGLDVIPILADGIRYFGFLPKPRIFLTLGYFNDVVSKGEGFSTFAWQYDARAAWLPYFQKEENKLFYIGGSYRYGKPLDGKITLKSRPESNPAPQIINTGAFLADHSIHLSGEAYYSTGRMLIGSEVLVHQFFSTTSGGHKFYGGNFFITYLFTNSTRPYAPAMGVFGFIPVKNSVFKGGWGEWEGVLHFSTLDLNDGAIKGGKFWRITPMINWYMSKVVRLEFIYGYGILDRYNITGAAQFFQTRLQIGIL